MRQSHTLQSWPVSREKTGNYFFSPLFHTKYMYEIGESKLGAHLWGAFPQCGDRATGVSLLSHVAFPQPQPNYIGDDQDILNH